MRIFLLIVASLTVVKGISFILIPHQMKSFFSHMLSLNTFKPVGAASFILSIFLFIASPYGRFPLVIILVGIEELFKGLFLMLASYEKSKFLINWLASLQEGSCRFLGIIVLIFGILIGVSVK
jgi:uncharacterized protein YjeT (DUF2065 family)